MFTYRLPEESTPTLGIIQLDYARLTFGARPFLRCPRCDARRTDLYLGPDGRLGCRGRTCLRLGYQSERRHDARIDALFHDRGRLIQLSDRARTGCDGMAAALLLGYHRKLEERNARAARRKRSWRREEGV